MLQFARAKQAPCQTSSSFLGLGSTRQPSCAMLEPPNPTLCLSSHGVIQGDGIPLLMPGMGGMQGMLQGRRWDRSGCTGPFGESPPGLGQRRLQRSRYLHKGQFLQGNQPSSSEIKIVLYVGSCSSVAVSSTRPMVGRGALQILHGDRKVPDAFPGDSWASGWLGSYCSLMLKVHFFSPGAHDLESGCKPRFNEPRSGVCWTETAAPRTGNVPCSRGTRQRWLWASGGTAATGSCCHYSSRVRPQNRSYPSDTCCN